MTSSTNLNNVCRAQGKIRLKIRAGAGCAVGSASGNTDNPLHPDARKEHTLTGRIMKQVFLLPG
jgi:hypothetical protein